MTARTRRSTLLITAFAALAALAPSLGHSAHGNLLPNASFEESAFEPSPVPKGTLEQPLLPSGWAFEGSAGLFDHYPKGSGGRETDHGVRAIAISIPASTKRQLCDQAVGCVDNPINPARDAARVVYSITPHWRTALPVAVQGNKTYRLSAWTQMEIVTLGEGASARVRWLDANGVPVGEDMVWERRATAADNGSFGKTISGTVKAPGDARQAIVMLGHTDDIWIGQVRFDNAYFGLH